MQVLLYINNAQNAVETISKLSWAGVWMKLAVPIIILLVSACAIPSKSGRLWLWYCFAIGIVFITVIDVFFAIGPTWCLRHHFWQALSGYLITAVMAWIIYGLAGGEITELTIKRELVITSLFTFISVVAMRTAAIQRLQLEMPVKTLWSNDIIVGIGVLLMVGYWETTLMYRGRAIDKLFFSVFSVVALVILSGIPVAIPILLRAIIAISIGFTAGRLACEFVLKMGVSRETNFLKMSGEETTDFPVWIRMLYINGMLTLLLLFPLVMVIGGGMFGTTQGSFRLLPTVPAIITVLVWWFINLGAFKRVAWAALIRDWRRPPLKSPWFLLGWMLTWPLEAKTPNSESFQGRAKQLIAKNWILLGCGFGALVGYILNRLLWQNNMPFFARHQWWVDWIEWGIVIGCTLTVFLFSGMLKLWGVKIVSLGRSLKALLWQLPKNIGMLKQINSADTIRHVVERIAPDAGRMWITLASNLSSGGQELFSMLVVSWLNAREHRPSANDDDILSAMLSRRIISPVMRKSMVEGLFISKQYDSLRQLQRRGQLDGPIIAEMLWHRPSLANQVIEYDVEIAFNSLFFTHQEVRTPVNGVKDDSEIEQFLASQVTEESLMTLLSEASRFQRLWFLIPEDKRNVLCPKLPLSIPASMPKNKAAHDYFWRSPLSQQKKLIDMLKGRAATFFEADSVSTSLQMKLFATLDEQSTTAILEGVQPIERTLPLFQSIRPDQEKLTRVMEALSSQRLAKIFNFVLPE